MGLFWARVLFFVVSMMNADGASVENTDSLQAAPDGQFAESSGQSFMRRLGQKLIKSPSDEAAAQAAAQLEKSGFNDDVSLRTCILTHRQYCVTAIQM